MHKRWNISPQTATRNLFISKLVASQEGNTLVLAQYIEKQLVPLCEMIIERCKENREIYLIYGATPTDDREKGKITSRTK